MKKGLWNKRMPTLPAFILLFVSIWVTSYLIQTRVIFTGRASIDKTPQNVKISNITDSSFTVSFTTNAKSTSGLSVEEAGKNSHLVYDDRNKKTETQNEFYSHYITASDLSPQTPYNFIIIADGESYYDGNQKYFVRTAPPIPETLSSQTSIIGKGLLPDGEESQDTIIELKIGGGQLITALTKTNGEFTIPTNSIRKEDLSEYLKIDPETPITITLQRQDLSSTLKTLFKNADSLGNLTLGQNYDFIETREIESSTRSSVLRAPSPKVTQGTIRILSPRENESFVDMRPLFKGAALPNQKVKITIESEVIIDEVTADRNGAWSYRAPTPIGSGQHKITIETIDSFGVSKILTANFTVFAQGSQVAESATPSATPAITLTPTPTIPIVTLTPTPTTTLPTLTPTPTQVPIVTPAPPGSSSSIILTVISALLIFAGSTLLFVL